MGVAFAGTVALWWCYFERVEGIGTHAVEAADDAGAIGLLSTFVLTALLLALIAVAVGGELAIAPPGDEPRLGFAVLAFGGPALFLLAQVRGIRAVTGRFALPRLAAVVALGLLAVVTAPLTLLAGVGAATAVLLAVAVADTVS